MWYTCFILIFLSLGPLKEKMMVLNGPVLTYIVKSEIIHCKLV